MGRRLPARFDSNGPRGRGYSACARGRDRFSEPVRFTAPKAISQIRTYTYALSQLIFRFAFLSNGPPHLCGNARPRLRADNALWRGQALAIVIPQSNQKKRR